ncbi:hypothetical protein MRB53_041084 [Persea americana]|nr:hypothetical protein MRB53_041084 [Persea americana]
MSLLARAATATATAAAASATTSGANASTEGRPPIYKAIGIILAVCSGVFIGTSFVLKKTGLLKANVKYNEEAGEGYGYLKNVWWWSGMTLMILGEICNFVAYAFVDAILVTPLGALSVVITTILSAIFLKERLSFVGKIGCFNCIVGSIIIVISTPAQSSAATIQEMKSYVISPGFLTYAGVIIVGCVFIALWAGPRYGKKSMLVYLSICSLIGGLSVVATQGLGAAIVTQISGTPQFNQWFLYVLLVFVICTLLTEIIYLNKALNIFNAALVTPTYYVFFTSSTIVTSAILFRGFKGTVTQIVDVVLGFLTICSGVVLLQLSKSAKDVPDAAVFKGDLDQVRTIAEQEEHEGEIKADGIRGAAALVRTFSKSHLRREAEEAKRIQEERMEPIGENEAVEWDGIRRRKTVLQPGQTHLIRRKTIHPPLGMAHFPSPEDEARAKAEADADDHDHDDGAGGIMNNIRKRTHSVLHPHTATHRRKASAGGTSMTDVLPPPRHDSYPPGTGTIDVRMGTLDPTKPSFRTSTASALRHPSTSTAQSDTSDPSTRPHVFGLPLGLRRDRDPPFPLPLSSLPADTAYRGASSSTTQSTAAHISNDGAFDPARTAAHAQGAPSPTFRDKEPHSRRAFSFQNPFHRLSTPSASPSLHSSDFARADVASAASSASRHLFSRRKPGVGVSEEERLGLVKGDSRVALTRYESPERMDEEEKELAEEEDDHLEDHGGEQSDGYAGRRQGGRGAYRGLHGNDDDEEEDEDPWDAKAGWDEAYRDRRDGRGGGGAKGAGNGGGGRPGPGPGSGSASASGSGVPTGATAFV